jgi:hypothetical protein
VELGGEPQDFAVEHPLQIQMRLAETLAAREVSGHWGNRTNHPAGFVPKYSKFRNRLQQRPDGLRAVASLVFSS